MIEHQVKINFHFHQVKINFHFGEWFLKPIYLNKYETPDKRAVITQATWLFISYRNIRYK